MIAKIQGKGFSLNTALEVPSLLYAERAKPWKGFTDFVEGLALLESLATLSVYRGFCKCFICDETLARKDFTYKGWMWSEEFSHAIVRHYAKPNRAFREFVDQQAYEIRKGRKK